jgi:hypothetical protein
VGKVGNFLFFSSCPASHHLEIRGCFLRGKVTIIEADLSFIHLFLVDLLQDMETVIFVITQEKQNSSTQYICI